MNQRESIPEYARLGESVDFFPSQFSQQFASLFSFFYFFIGFQRVFFFSFLFFLFGAKFRVSISIVAKKKKIVIIIIIIIV
jgi:hypothetical protein